MIFRTALALALMPLAALAQEEARQNTGIDVARVYESTEEAFRIEQVAEGLGIPFGMAFLPDGSLLVSSREAATMHIVDADTGALVQITGFEDSDPALPGPHFRMKDILLHPDYAENGWIYFSSIKDTGGQQYALVLERGRLQGHRMANIERLYTSTETYTDPMRHHSGRIAIRSGYVFLSDGERYDLLDEAQNLANTFGTIVRLHDDGRTPADNPFAAADGADPRIWTYGHRNIHGMTVNPFTGALWAHEHGPQGGDEINIIRGGRNYGWPVITYGDQYGGGEIRDGRAAAPAMEQPVYFYKPSIAPSGMFFYTGDAFPGWHGNLFIGAMALTHLNRVTVVDGRVVNEERLLEGLEQRIRVTRQGPDGLVYIGTDDGLVLRLVPAAAPDREEAAE